MKKPRDYTRFFIQGNACNTHDARGILKDIRSQTLIIGGELDETLGPEPSRRLNREIGNSTLYMYPEYGHGLYETAPDFYDRILAFLER